MSFASDNWAPAHPAILAAMVAANEGLSPAYGLDPLTEAAERALHALFETECAVFLVPTGTGANGLALAALTPPWGAVFAHTRAHVVRSECGGPEFFTGGARAIGLPGAHGKLAPDTLAAEIARHPRSRAHGMQPRTLSLTQATDFGTLYTAEETSALAGLAHAQGLKVHMDGARLANACAALGKSPAELTWRAGIDALSFGATKNGAMACEAVIVFDPEAAESLPYRRMRAGHLLSKHRWLAAQMVAFLKDNLWLDLATHANAIAAQLGASFATAGFPPLHPVESNQIFVSLPPVVQTALSGADVGFHPWEPAGVDGCRFVASWSNTLEEVERVATLARAAA